MLESLTGPVCTNAVISLVSMFSYNIVSIIFLFDILHKLYIVYKIYNHIHKLILKQEVLLRTICFASNR